MNGGTAYGGAGNDTVAAAYADSEAYGGSGKDTLSGTPNESQLLDCGAALDRVTFFDDESIDTVLNRELFGLPQP